MHTLSRATLLACASLFSACATDPTCDICLTEAIVYGRVTIPGGAAAAGVIVRGLQRSPDCDGPTFVGWDSGAITDSNGDYRMQIRDWYSPGQRCVVLAFVPEVASGFAAAADTVPALYFHPTWTGSGRRDSVRVDIDLTTAP